MNKLNTFLTCLIFSIGILLRPVISSAGEAANFTISPVYDNGQTDNRLGYFSINYAHLESYPLKIKIKNLSSETEADFDVKLISATTNNNGKIDYTPSNKKQPNTKLLSLEEFVSTNQLNQTIHLQPNEEKEVSIELKKPIEYFDGVILGSVYVEKKGTDDNLEKKKGINNVFAMSIPIIISQNFDKKIDPKIELDNVGMTKDAGDIKIRGDVLNLSPVMFGEITIEGWITPKNNNDKLYESVNHNFEMAPNSQFSYFINLQNEMLSPGTYTYHLKLTSGKKSFNFSEDFIIKSQGSSTKSSILDNKKNTKIESILIGILTGGIFAFLLSNYLILIKKYDFPYVEERRKNNRNDNLNL